jgi:hypothetical protein
MPTESFGGRSCYAIILAVQWVLGGPIGERAMQTSYAEIDSQLEAWAKTASLAVCRQYKDEEVRSTDVVDDQGCRYQIWVERAELSEWSVKAWDFGLRQFSGNGPADEVGRRLVEALDCVLSWIRQDGHTKRGNAVQR